MPYISETELSNLNQKIDHLEHINKGLLEACKTTKMLSFKSYGKGTIGNKVYLEIEQAIAKAEEE